MLSGETGEYFEKNGQIKDNIQMQYYKTNEWNLQPEVKGPVPEDSDYQLAEGI